MKIIKKTLLLERDEYFKKHLLIINHLLPIQMTPKEAEVLAAFLSLEGNLKNDPFSTTGRKIVKEVLKISSGGLGNYLDQLKTKGFILEDTQDLEKKLSILPVLIPSEEMQGYQFKLQINE